MSLTVRPAAAADVPAIAAIYGPAVLTGTASFEVDPPDEAEMLRRFEAITGAGYPYFVAEVHGRVAGYAYASAYRTRPRATASRSRIPSTSPPTRRAKALAGRCSSAWSPGAATTASA